MTKKKVRQCLWVKDSDRYQCKTCALDCADRRCPYDSLEAINKATIPVQKERDEIDEWLEKECNIHAGCCSSIENLKYDVAREVAEKLMKKDAAKKQDTSKFRIERDKWYVCIKDLYDPYGNKIFYKGDIYFSPEDGSLIPTNSNVPYEMHSPETYFKNWSLIKELAEQISNP